MLLKCNIIFLLLILGCFPLLAQKKLRVAVAANFTQTAREIEVSFEKYHDIDIEIIPASSGKLTSQIINNAPFDIFFSADTNYPEHLYSNRKCYEPVIYAKGRLVFWSKDKPEGSLEVFINSLPKHTLAIANPILAPYGKKAEEWLDHFELDKIGDKFVTAENVGQVNQYIYLKSVLAAVTAASAQHSEVLENIGYWHPVSLNYSIDHAACIVKYNDKFEEAESFWKFVLSPEGQTILSKYGYLSPN